VAARTWGEARRSRRPRSVARPATAAAERAKKWRAFLLTAPLLLFLLLTFLDHRSAADAQRRRHRVCVGAAERLARDPALDGRALPDEATFAALVHDVRAAREAAHSRRPPRGSTTTSAAFDRCCSRRKGLPDPLPGSAHDALVEIDTRWGEVETWGAIARASGPVTSLFVLAALDLKRTADGGIVGAPTNEKIFVQVLARTSALRRR